jgi:hypothetical protein
MGVIIHVTAKANKTKYALDDVEVAPCLPSLLTLTDSTGEALTYVARPGPSSMKGTDRLAGPGKTAQEMSHAA